MPEKANWSGSSSDACGGGGGGDGMASQSSAICPAAPKTPCERSMLVPTSPARKSSSPKADATARVARCVMVCQRQTITFQIGVLSSMKSSGRTGSMHSALTHDEVSSSSSTNMTTSSTARPVQRSAPSRGCSRFSPSKSTPELRAQATA